VGAVTGLAEAAYKTGMLVSTLAGASNYGHLGIEECRPLAEVDVSLANVVELSIRGVRMIVTVTAPPEEQA
jgi:hypothetical protein